MASYNLKFNRDDSVIRHILIGLCANLNKKIYVMNQISQEERKKIDVPFYFSFTGEEDVLYDYFLLDDSVDPERKKAIGNYDVVPRGIVNVNSFNVDSSALLNKFVRGNYQKEVDGQLKSYVSQLQMIPVIMSCDCKIWVDTQLDLFRITEKLIRTLYKNNLYQVDVGHIEDGTYRVPVIYKLPEDYEMDRPIEFSFDDEKRKSVNFSIELNTFIPSFEKDDEQFAGNRMFEFTQNTESSVNVNKPPIGGTDSIWNKVNK